MKDKRTWKKVKRKILAFPIYAPFFLIALGIVLVGIAMYNSSINNTQQLYRETMERMALECEEKIGSVVGGIQYLIKEDCVIQFMNTNEPDMTRIGEFNKTLNDFISSYNGIDSAFILNPNKKTVVDGTGERELTDYFSEKYYRSYPPVYWQNIFFIDNKSYRVLSPTVYSDPKGEKNVIPIVFRKAGNTKSLNFLVINLDFDIFLERQIKTEIVEKSRVCVLNRYTGQIFGEKDGIDGDNIFDTELYAMLVGGKNGFYCNVEGIGKSFIVSYATSDNLVGYTYFSVIPNSYLNRIRISAVFVILVGAMICVAACLMLLKSVRGVMTPVKKIIESSDDNEKNINLDDVEKRVEKLLRQSAELKHILPFAREQYLIKYLNSMDFYNNEDFEELIKKYFSFQRPYFSVVILQMYPTAIFYETYTDKEYDNIRRGFYHVVETLFKEMFDTIVLTADKEALCVIVNVDEPDELKKTGIINHVFDYLKNDMEYINLFVGNGGFYRFLEGIKKSYQEAVGSIKLAPKPKRDGILGWDAHRNALMLSGRDENLLFTALTEGRIDDAANHISELAAEVKNKDEKNKKQLLTRILNVVLRVMSIKNIDYEGKMEYEIYNEVLGGSADNIYRKILVLLDAFPEKMERRTSKSESDKIIEYIQKNYNNTELSREMIADMFNMQPNYLSTLIKNRIGINFKDYIVSIRVEKAKDMLVEKDKSIQQIYKDVGFGSKQTFYRTFKRVVGITPSEYRRAAAEGKLGD